MPTPPIADAAPPPVTSPLRTIGQIAAELGVSFHRVDWVIKTRAIPYSCRAGTYRMFDQFAIARIADELELIEERKGARG